MQFKRSGMSRVQVMEGPRSRTASSGAGDGAVFLFPPPRPRCARICRSQEGGTWRSTKNPRGMRPRPRPLLFRWLPFVLPHLGDLPRRRRPSPPVRIRWQDRGRLSRCGRVGHVAGGRGRERRPQGRGREHGRSPVVFEVEERHRRVGEGMARWEGEGAGAAAVVSR
jgi:hypothetical protein